VLFPVRPISRLDAALGMGEACRWLSCLKVDALTMSPQPRQVFA
jgi:hypothetical protein